ncbi:Dynamin family-domain-containing protein [Rhodofomes roseus]|uniref:Dynamin family-domain-containing protein n=1 Tax=Rhodofomes roseus TaxID=34475 RepID=A0ABQ8L016_9APHY|nr:Dynamin family-domain-containing protein [Rhodofomes roseus]KAH9844070.1 Dynamin family-domain-containing protein [Rhodofomes roseus]
MSAKENEASRANAMPFIKPEPEEYKILAPGVSENSADVKSPGYIVKPEPAEAGHAAFGSYKPDPDAGSDGLGAQDYGANGPRLPPRAAPLSRTSSKITQPLYKVFKSVEEINYLPEEALNEGLGMVKTIKANIKTLEVGSKLRKEVWLREIESLQSQGAPTTMIAVCGATGAGKSSILNAILDDNIVPTSGMRACTAVVTEIAYHAKKTIDADISFLSEREWRDELAVLLKDMIDEDGNVKRTTDLRGEAGVAWSKVHAVYPKITQDMLAHMSVDQIIAREPKIRAILGTTKHVCANDSKTFAKEVAKYIDSKEKKHGKKNKKDKEKEKEASGSLMDLLKKDSGKKKDKDDDGSAYWPLIRQVQVKCDSPALSTGAILVDLPGVADANAARNNIAKDYMKKCDCIWILAPITRAVDDKTARDLMGDAFRMQLMMDGVYDDHAITFIASKCDDVSCSEVIQALSLEDEPELEAIEEQIGRCRIETNEWRRKKADAEDSVKDMEAKLKEIRAYLAEYKEHKTALKDGEPFVPRITAKSSGKKESTSRGKKRKNQRGGKKGSSKKRKSSFASSDEDQDDFIDDESDFSEQESDSDSEKESDKSDDDDEGSDGSGSESSDKEDEDEENQDGAEAEEVTVESLERKIKEANDAIKAGRTELSELRKQKKEANDMLATLKKKQTKVQRDKNAFCSLRRSEFSREVLKDDFRQGLKDLDDAAAEERDPDSFDPTRNIRDYSAINLPVFTCSARDYVRIKGQVKGDGDPSCFCKVEDTGIPDLQKWCHRLTVASRERAARNFLNHLKTFANGVKSYVEGIGDVTAADRESMREKWESMQDEDDDPMDGMHYGGGWASSDPMDDMDGLDPYALAGLPRANLYRMQEPAAPKVDKRGDPVGIVPRLVKEFKQVIEECVQGLQDRFRDGLEEKCKVGAENASSAAVETSDVFAASMHWATYRATLRRHGSWRQDLNVELTNPFTRQIASSWQKVFEADLFASFEKSTLTVIDNLLHDVEQSAASGLKERARGQGELCLQEAKIALQKTLDVVRDTVTSQQKETSRCLAPHIQEQLFDGYDAAMEERGTGSVARQKAVFHNYVGDIKDEMFNGAVDVLFGRLDAAAEAVGKALEEAFEALAQKIEVSIAVLWEGVRDDPAQVKAREAVIASMTEMIEQVGLWQQADTVRQPPAGAMDEAE